MCVKNSTVKRNQYSLQCNRDRNNYVATHDCMICIYSLVLGVLTKAYAHL